MGTTKPAIRTHTIPITEPYKPPLVLPAPDPDRIYEPMTPRIPVQEPVRVSVRKETHYGVRN